MGVEVRPLGVLCNVSCKYCYQNPQRLASNTTKSYNLEAIKTALTACNSSFTLFGGEPLLVPLNDLEELWRFGFEKFGRNGIQTNATLISAEHVRLFKTYNVTVGISLDGPGSLNSLRWAGSPERTQDATAIAHKAVEWLCSEGIETHVIATLHRANASSRALPLFCEWVMALDAIGVKGLRAHALEIDDPKVREHYALNEGETITAFLALADLEVRLCHLRLDVFKDIEQMLLGNDKQVTCTWRACDPYTTAAVLGIEGDGRLSNCGRTNKDGIDFVKGSRPGYERYIALFNTPYEYGGCAGCRFFIACKGHCPGTAIDGDWRNRTANCGLWMELLMKVEQRLVRQGKVPLSQSDNRQDIERKLLAFWAEGQNPDLVSIHP